MVTKNQVVMWIEDNSTLVVEPLNQLGIHLDSVFEFLSLSLKSIKKKYPGNKVLETICPTVTIRPYVVSLCALSWILLMI